MGAVVECAAFAAGSWLRDVPVAELRRILAAAQNNDFVWVSLEEPDDALLECFREPLNLHELAIEDMEKAAQHGATPHGTALRLRCEHAPLHVARGPMHALHAIFDVIVDEWAPVVDELDEVLETLEERLLSARRAQWL